MDKGKASLTDGASVILLPGLILGLPGLAEEAGRAVAAHEQNGSNRYLQRPYFVESGG